MKPAFSILDGIAALDFSSVYGPVSHLKSVNFMPDFSWKRCSFAPETVDDNELQSTADQIKNSLLNHDFIIAMGKFLTGEKPKEITFSQWLEICKFRSKKGIGVYRFVITV